MNVFEMRTSVSRPQIQQLVYRFYDRVREDPELGPIFDGAIAGDRWPVHLERMVAFWSTTLHGRREYLGNPMLAHARVEALRDHHFDRWLELFGETTAEIFDPPVAASVLQRAVRMGHGLRSSLGVSGLAAST